MNSNAARLGILFILSGPSGSGKTTLCKRAERDGLARYAISATTRPPRSGETNGSSYHFLSTEEFQSKIKNNAFLEHASVHGNYYGTLESEVLAHIETGTDLVLDIDVQGADLIRQHSNPIIKKSIVDLFVMPSSASELETRLRERNTDSEKTIQLRIKNALHEMQRWVDYTYVLHSTDRDSDYHTLKAILFAERQKSYRLLPLRSLEVCAP